MSDEHQPIKSVGEARHVIGEMAHNKPKKVIKKHKYGHMDVANQTIKMINSSIKDPFIRKVMTMRILGPALTGKERSHLSIAIELRASELTVRQAEAHGINMISLLMERVSLPDFVQKFNRERSVVEAVKNMGKSTILANG